MAAVSCAGRSSRSADHALPKAQCAVLVGTALDPTRARIVNHVKTRTLWGTLAAILLEVA